MRRAIGTPIHVKKAADALIFTNGKNIGIKNRSSPSSSYENLSEEQLEGAMRDSVFEARQEDIIYEYEETVSTNDPPASACATPPLQSGRQSKISAFVSVQSSSADTLKTQGMSENGDMSEEDAMAAAVAASLATRGSEVGYDSEEEETGECHLCGGDYYYQVCQYLHLLKEF